MDGEADEYGERVFRTMDGLKDWLRMEGFAFAGDVPCGALCPGGTNAGFGCYMPFNHETRGLPHYARRSPKAGRTRWDTRR